VVVSAAGSGPDSDFVAAADADAQPDLPGESCTSCDTPAHWPCATPDMLHTVVV